MPRTILEGGISLVISLFYLGFAHLVNTPTKYLAGDLSQCFPVGWVALTSWGTHRGENGRGHRAVGREGGQLLLRLQRQVKSRLQRSLGGPQLWEKATGLRSSPAGRS